MSSYSSLPVSRFEKLNLLGEGTYGSVFRARDKESGEIVALKKIRISSKEKSGGGGGFPLTSLREVSLLRYVHHPHIVELRHIAVGRKMDSIFLVFEHLQYDLADLLDRMSRPFTESETKTLMLQLLSAVNFLHQNFIVHRDLKLSNLLLDAKGRLKLADFGLARQFSNPLKAMTPKVVTLWYRAPELLLGTDKYHSAVDMWAVGCIFGELLRHRPLLPGKTELSQLALICDLLGSPNEKIWPGFTELHRMSGAAGDGDGGEPLSLPAQPYNNLSHQFSHLTEAGLDLLSRLLTYDPSKRITASKALNHPYFLEEPKPIPTELMPRFAPATIHTTTPTTAAAGNESVSAIPTSEAGSRSMYSNMSGMHPSSSTSLAASSTAIPPVGPVVSSSKKRKHESIV